MDYIRDLLMARQMVDTFHIGLVFAGYVVAVIVINAARPRGSITAEARQALGIYELPICPTAIVNRAALADALIDGRGVQELDAKGKAADEIKAVWRWIKRRL